MSSSFSLTTELNNHILAIAVHSLVDPRPGCKDASFLLPILNVAGPRSEYPDVTKTAIARVCWWIDHDVASRLGDLNLLQLLDSMAAVRPLQWSRRAMDNASTNGHVQVLEYWLRVKGAMRCVYSDKAIVGGARNGHRHVLEWWIGVQAELSLPHTEAELHQMIVEQLAFGGHCDLLQWWTVEFTDKLPTQPVTAHVLAHAIAGAFSRPGTTDLTAAYRIMTAHQIDFKCPRFASAFAEERTQSLLTNTLSANIHITRNLAFATWAFLHKHDLATALNQLDLLASVRDAGTDVLNLTYLRMTKENIGEMYVAASLAGSVRTLKWLVRVDSILQDSPQPVVLEVIVRSMRHAAAKGHVAILGWWWDQSPYLDDCIDDALEACPTLFDSAILDAVTNDQVDVLEWFWEEMFCWDTTHFRWPAGLVRHASRFGSVNTLQWWRQYGEERQIAMDPDAVDVASANGQLKAVEFWFEQGMIQLDRYQGISPFTDRDEVADLHVDGGWQGERARDQVFAWWILSGMAAARPFSVLVGLSLSTYPILLQMFLHKFLPNVHICPSHDMLRLAHLKQPVLLACKVRGRGYDSMADYWNCLDVGVVDPLLQDRQQRIESRLQGYPMDGLQEWSALDRMLLFTCSSDIEYRTLGLGLGCIDCGYIALPAP